MPTILTKRSSTAGAVPTSSQLTAGETAVNTADAYLYVKHTDGSVKRIGTTADNVSVTAVGSIPGGSLQDALVTLATTDFVQQVVNSISYEVITTSQNFTVPAGTTRIYVSLVGGGGGGAGSLDVAPYSGGGGGSGRVVYRSTFTVTPGQVIPVTIGAGGAGGVGVNSNASPPVPLGGNYANSNGGTGGISSFGSLITASGGAGGACQAGHSRGGVAGGTTFCSNGKSGEPVVTTQTEAGGDGGGNIFSSTSPGGHDGSGSGVLYGGGGAGGRATAYWFSGQPGASGVCIVEW